MMCIGSRSFKYMFFICLGGFSGAYCFLFVLHCAGLSFVWLVGVFFI